MNLSMMLTIFAILVVLTNVLVNVIKGVATVQQPKRVVLAVAIVLALIVAVGMGLYLQFAVWYQWAGAALAALVGGSLVAYVAMYGYDQGYDDIVALVQKLIGYINGGGGLHE